MNTRDIEKKAQAFMNAVDGLDGEVTMMTHDGYTGVPEKTLVRVSIILPHGNRDILQELIDKDRKRRVGESQ